MQEEATKKRAFSMLEKRDYSVKELTDRLLEKGEPPEAVHALTARLVELGVLDDARYAGLVTRHYAAKGYGARRIRDELYRRGVPKPLWDEALGELPEPDDTVDRLLRARLRGAQADRDALRKASAALQRRGFSYDEISAAIARYAPEAAEE